MVVIARKKGRIVEVAKIERYLLGYNVEESLRAREWVHAVPHDHAARMSSPSSKLLPIR